MAIDSPDNKGEEDSASGIRFRRPTFLRTLSTSIRTRGAHGSLPMKSNSINNGDVDDDADDLDGKVNLEAGVLEVK